MSDLATTYLGLSLTNPLVASASPLSEDLDNIRRLEDAGAGAVVLHSLFEEQINLESQDLDRFLSYGTDSFAEAQTYFPDMTQYNLGPDGYLEHVRKAKAAVGIPIIALNMVGSITDHVDLVISDPVQAGTMAVMAVADTASFELAKQKGRRY